MPKYKERDPNEVEPTPLKTPRKTAVAKRADARKAKIDAGEIVVPATTNRSTKDEVGLTARQRSVLDFIRATMDTRGYPPSIREIGDAVGLHSSSSVAYQLSSLAKKGLLLRDERRPRAVVLSEPGQVKLSAVPSAYVDDSEAEMRPTPAYVPLVGQIAAGGPILAEEHIEQVMPLPRDLVGDGQLFMLKVVGDSMIDAAICSGDYVVVRSQSDADNGDIVAALLDNEATVKTLRRKNGHVWLMPHNDAYEPINGDHASIMGKVVAVLRRV